MTASNAAATRPKVRVSLPYKPRAHQRAAHALLMTVRFLVLVWHRRCGKTLFAVLELFLGALQCKLERGRFAYIAPQLNQAKGIAWDYLKTLARSVPGTVINEAELWVELPTGHRVRIYGADNPDAFRGLYFDGVVMDELAQMKPQVWGQIIRPALADRQGWCIFIGTPKGVNLLSELYYRALKGEEGWAADLKRHSDTNALSEEELAQMRREMTEAEWAQEMECDFNAAVENVLINLADVLKAQERSALEADFSFAARVIGVDCARYGGDRSVIAFRQGIVAFRPKILPGMDTMSLAGAVAKVIDDWHPDATFIDIGSFGAGVFDRLRQLDYDVIPVDFGGKPSNPKYENKRAEIWDEMREWVATVGCLPDIPELREDLPGPRYTYKNKRGHMQLESKESMLARGVRSPDVGDGYACTFTMPVQPKPKINIPGHQEGYAVGHDYDPLDVKRFK